MALNQPVPEYDLAPASGPASQPSAPLGNLKAPPVQPRGAVGFTALFMVLGGGLVIGTILQQQKLDYCPNDAARWNTVYYLVEHGTYEYVSDHGAPWNGKKAKGLEDYRDALPFWTIDMVALRDAEGKYHFHSSKPPLLSTVVAGVVLALEKVTEAVDAAVRNPDGPPPQFIQDVAPGLKTLKADYRANPWFIMRTALILVQAVPFLFFVWLMSKFFRSTTQELLVFVFCLATAALGTSLTGWSVTLNNHVLAGFTGLFAAYAAIQVWYENRREWYWFASAGFFGALAAAMEMPALALTTVVLAALLWKDWRKTLLLAVPLALIPAAGFFLTNYIEVGSFRPVQMRFDEANGPYHYPGSYWNNPNGMDALKEPNAIYLLHVLIGHHGLFLLMPVLLLSLLGAGRHLRRAGIGATFLVTLVLLAAVGVVFADVAQEERLIQGFQQSLAWLRPGQPILLPQGYALLAPLALLLLMNLGMYLPAPANPRPMLALAVLLMTTAVLVFYASPLTSQHNYGGTAQGFRWMFWLIPLWLLLLPAGVEWAARRWSGRLVCCSLLLVSTLTVGFALRQPWSKSWAHMLFGQLGWIAY